MTELLITHRIPPAVTPLAEWLSEVADRVTLVTGEEGYDHYRGAFPRVYSVPDYSTNQAAQILLEEVCRNRPVTTLIHVTEDDILRCAKVRDRFDLPGLRYAEALPWRDKFHMKKQVRAAGLAVPDFMVPDSLENAQEFARRVGYPVVVKPRLGFASRGVELVSGPAELARAAASWDPGDVMLEQYVEGDVYHIDGFTAAGETTYVSVSRYLNNCLSFHDSEPLGSVQLEPGTAEFARFADIAAGVVAALPPVEFCPFHLEVFRRPDGELVFCEIACRLGGAHIMETLTYTTGINPARLWIRHQAGLEDGRKVKLSSGDKRYGFLLIPPRAGRLVELRAPVGYPFIKDFIVKTAVPRVFDGAHGSTDSYIAFVVEGNSSDELEDNLRRCIQLSDELSRWEEVHDRV